MTFKLDVACPCGVALRSSPFLPIYFSVPMVLRLCLKIYALSYMLNINLYYIEGIMNEISKNLQSLFLYSTHKNANNKKTLIIL